ncbi:NAD(P)H-hydrate dehydratase [Pelolinea submarina]|uniref:Bifunctional NAD(P)H-hydrate repair enzyme n=1 Tax=Pelolinea submarina TaxID=913107 RepID=A0A347ZU22_9CHLR|nr:NAD(P)H-hydrate dehydratase [Pelolinea submarina]REG10612.1 NAD(P)H-hydrate epimerase [Pelolinea submarina]BBB48803.1 ADP-dependent NAD(P)H-hydrate dehydratase /NAD(P)H-hydrate epimerase [Pelolinea submarina]
MKRVSVAQMKALEGQADASGLSYDQMMANAGLALAQAVHRRYFRRPTCSVLGLVGSGNNGGDCLIALRYLAEWGWQTQAYLLKERVGDEALLTDYRKAGGQVLGVNEDHDFEKLRQHALQADLIMDGVLGTGIRLPLKGDIQHALAVLKEIKDLPPVVAVDCPSGVDCDSGKAAKECLRADLTVCMAAIKAGLLKQPALGLAGEIYAVGIGLGDNLPAWAEADVDVMDARMAVENLPERPADSHKGTYGTCLIAAGSVNYCGAALLAARAAYRMGTGLVRVGVPGSIYDTLAGQLPEATWLILPHTSGVINSEAAKVVWKNLERVNALLIGPGWGLENETKEFLEDLLNLQKGKGNASPLGFVPEEHELKNASRKLPALVIDADGLKLLAQIENWQDKIQTAVLTPHPGEMAVMSGLSIAKIQADREAIAREYAQRWGHVLVLKGAMTIVANPAGEVAIIPMATSALATAGTGDVLAGMITGLIAQGLEPYTAAKTAAWLHARAGIKAARQLGSEASVMAGDVIAQLPQVLNEISS